MSADNFRVTLFWFTLFDGIARNPLGQLPLGEFSRGERQYCLDGIDLRRAENIAVHGEKQAYR